MTLPLPEYLDKEKTCILFVKILAPQASEAGAGGNA
jgi:hypothetical protein